MFFSDNFFLFDIKIENRKKICFTSVRSNVYSYICIQEVENVIFSETNLYLFLLTSSNGFFQFQ